MAVLTKGVDFTTGDQVTAANLDALVDSATFASGAVDGSTTQLSGGAIIVKDGGITTAKLAAGGVSVPGTTTNDSAATGYVGEYVTATVDTGSPVSLTSNVAANITSISLTAGDWDVQGNPYIALGTTTTVSACNWWVSTTSATYPGGTLQVSYYSIAIPAAASQAFGFPTPMFRISIAGTTTVYFSIAATFATSTLTAAGSIRARRVR